LYEKHVWYNNLILNYRRRHVWAEQAPEEADILPGAVTVPDIPGAVIA
jgi:hypothetical protein